MVHIEETRKPFSLPNISIGELNFQESSKNDSPFQDAVENHEDFDSVAYYEIFLPSGGPLKPITEEICVESSYAMAFMNAVRPVTQSNKESLANLFDFAAEHGCSTLVACVKKDSECFKNIMASFMTVGFELIRDRTFPGFVLLGYQL